MSVFGFAGRLSSMIGLVVGRVLPCHAVARLISKELDAKSSRWERLAVRLHCHTCAACSTYRKHLEFIRSVSNSLGEHPDKISADHLSPEARLDLRRRMGPREK
jgi:hypothetical protein